VLDDATERTFLDISATEAVAETLEAVKNLGKDFAKDAEAEELSNITLLTIRDNDEVLDTAVDTSPFWTALASVTTPLTTAAISFMICLPNVATAKEVAVSVLEINFRRMAVAVEVTISSFDTNFRTETADDEDASSTFVIDLARDADEDDRMVSSF
jgi:hypothetical protein